MAQRPSTIVFSTGIIFGTLFKRLPPRAPGGRGVFWVYSRKVTYIAGIAPPAPVRTPIPVLGTSGSRGMPTCVYAKKNKKKHA